MFAQLARYEFDDLCRWFGLPENSRTNLGRLHQPEELESPSKDRLGILRTPNAGQKAVRWDSSQRCIEVEVHE